MKSICFVSTQLQLINCVEYLNFINSCDNTLVLCTDNKRRTTQVLTLLSANCYKNYFNKVINLSLVNNRLLNFLLSFVHTIILFFMSKNSQYDNILMGHYKSFYSRFYFSKLKKIRTCVLVDDGLATCTIVEGRNLELEGGDICCFIPNRFLSRMFSSNRTLIPSNVTYYTIYSIVCGQDKVCNNDYSYIKNHLEEFQIPECLLSTEVVFLGQPLYIKGNGLSPIQYSNYLKMFADENSGKQIIYYAHPEESTSHWNNLNHTSSYLFVGNTLPFEIITALLKPGCRIVSFFSSALPFIKEYVPSLIAESVYINREDYVDKTSYSYENAYRYFESINIPVHKYYGIQSSLK